MYSGLETYDCQSKLLETVHGVGQLSLGGAGLLSDNDCGRSSYHL
jgi:hypothetical protein